MTMFDSWILFWRVNQIIYIEKGNDRDNDKIYQENFKTVYLLTPFKGSNDVWLRKCVVFLINFITVSIISLY